MEQPDKLEFDFDGDIVGLDGDLLPLEGWGAADHSILDSLGVGEISSNGQDHATPEQPPDLSFVDQTTQTAVFLSERHFATAHLDTASIATTADTSHMQANSFDTGLSSKSKAKRGPRPRLFKKHRCQADGCHANLATYSFYYQRNHICVEHLKAESFNVHGVPSRFCQRCGLSHALTEFDGKRKSCRKALEKHNNRRKARAAGSEAGPSEVNGNSNGNGNGNHNGGPPTNGRMGQSIPGVGDVSGWDPQLARELEALLQDDPVVALPELMWSSQLGAAAAVAAAGGRLGSMAPPPAPGMLPPTARLQLDHAASCPAPQELALPRENGGYHVTELGCDGQPLSPTLLQLARGDSAAAVAATAAAAMDGLYPPQPMNPFAMELPSLERLASQGGQSPRVAQQQAQQYHQQLQQQSQQLQQQIQQQHAQVQQYQQKQQQQQQQQAHSQQQHHHQHQAQVHQQPNQQQNQQHQASSMQLQTAQSLPVSLPSPHPQQPHQQPVQVIVVAAPGMNLPNGMQLAHHGGGMQMLPNMQQLQLPAHQAMGQPPHMGNQQMQWVLMPSNMVVMPQQQQPQMQLSQHSQPPHHSQQHPQQQLTTHLQETVSQTDHSAPSTAHQ